MSFDVLVRTYHGGEKALRSNLIPTVNIFVNRALFRLIAVLDDESPADHHLGNRLLAEGVVDRVKYEPLPPDWQSLFLGMAFPPPYNRWGYDRQQWSTFHMDAYSDRDVLGVVDSDATFYSYLTRQNILSDDGRVLLNVYRPSKRSSSYFVRRLVRFAGGSAYVNDKIALGEALPYECMPTNRMPIWFWRSTFANCRRHIARHGNVEFDDAYRAFSRAPYCTFNILANYAIKYESDRYAIRLMDAKGGDLVAVGQNGCLSTDDVIIGGRRTFQIEGSQTNQDSVHLNRAAKMLCGVSVSKAHAARHYEAVHEELRKLPADRRAAMRNAFLEFLNGGYANVIVSPPDVSMRARLHWELARLGATHPTLASSLRRVLLVIRRIWPRR